MSIRLWHSHRRRNRFASRSRLSLPAHMYLHIGFLLKNRYYTILNEMIFHTCCLRQLQASSHNMLTATGSLRSST